MRLYVTDDYGIKHYLSVKAYYRPILKRAMQSLENMQGGIEVLGEWYEADEVCADTEIRRSMLTINCFLLFLYFLVAYACKFSDNWLGMKILAYAQLPLALLVFYRENRLAEDFNDS
jgi:hypothetical protein